MLLAGTGHIDQKGKKNFLIVDSSASRAPSIASDSKFDLALPHRNAKVDD
jgi:hypothetical protein